VTTTKGISNCRTRRLCHDAGLGGASWSYQLRQRLAASSIVRVRWRQHRLVEWLERRMLHDRAVVALMLNQQIAIKGQFL